MTTTTSHPARGQTRLSGLLHLAAACSLILAVGCSDGSDGPYVPVAPEAVPFQEILDQGVGRYLGRYTPMLSEQQGDAMVHTFGTGDGPLCIDEGPYIMSTRDTGSEDLMIFLQGGGACWWSELCFANETADPGIPKLGVLDSELDANPLQEWNVAYFNYCDGGMHASDKDIDTDGDGTNDLKQRGLHNLSAGLDVTVNTFPRPRRIVLTGVSGGGFGTIWALPLVRTLYPDVPIEVINDSGVGVGRPGDPEFVEQLLGEWNMEAFIPESCGRDCYPNGHITNYFDWQLDQDPNTRLGMMSYKQDFVISFTFSKVGGEVFQEELEREMAALEEMQPERMRSFQRDGNGHTFLQPTDPEEPGLAVTAGGVSVSDWVSSMLDDEAWVSTSD